MIGGMGHSLSVAHAHSTFSKSLQFVLMEMDHL